LSGTDQITAELVHVGSKQPEIDKLIHILNRDKLQQQWKYIVATDKKGDKII
jgi:hypothetical protein